MEIDCTDEAPLAAYVFKTVADPFVGKLSYVKVISGKLSSDAPVVNARTGQQEKLGKIIYVIGKKQEDTAYITAGDIGAVTNSPPPRPATPCATRRRWSALTRSTSRVPA